MEGVWEGGEAQGHFWEGVPKDAGHAEASLTEGSPLKVDIQSPAETVLLEMEASKFQG